MIEIWKDIKGFEGHYQVSNLGRVKSLSRYMNHKSGGLSLLKERILKPATNRKGYKIVVLCLNCKEYKFTVHRLVAKTFIPNPNNYPMINHKDEDKTNNCVDNLEWCDNKYNQNYGTVVRKRVRDIIDVYTLEGEFIETWYDGYRKLAEKYGISSKSQIYNCIYPHKKKDRPRAYTNNRAGNYIFKLHKNEKI